MNIDYLLKNRASVSFLKKYKIERLHEKMGCFFSENIIMNKSHIHASHGIAGMCIAAFEFTGVTIIHQNVTIGTVLTKKEIYQEFLKVF